MYNRMALPQGSMPQMSMNPATANQPMTGMMPGMMPGMMQTMPSGMTAVPNGSMPMNMTPPAATGALPVTTFLPTTGREESFVENILRMNLGKVATLYMTYENNSEWNAKIFKGVLEAAGRDHIIISDPATGKRFLLLMVNLDYITFDEPLNYNLPFGSANNPVTRR